MANKKTAKKEKIDNGQVDLKEILGDIKTVVSGEKEMLFKESEYKTINLKKENLVTRGKNIHTTGSIDINDKKLEDLIIKIVKRELKNFQIKNNSDNLQLEKRKIDKGIESNSDLDSFTKTKLLSLSNKNKLGLTSKNTKAEIIKEIKKNKIKGL